VRAGPAAATVRFSDLGVLSLEKIYIDHGQINYKDTIAKMSSFKKIDMQRDKGFWAGIYQSI
jgi:hypothetical protein